LPWIIIETEPAAEGNDGAWVNGARIDWLWHRGSSLVCSSIVTPGGPDARSILCILSTTLPLPSRARRTARPTILLRRQTPDLLFFLAILHEKNGGDYGSG
jgi:hypothetical protein